MSTAGSSPDLLVLALAYRVGGISLLPCSSKTKKPAPGLLPKDKHGKATWKPFQETPTDEATIRQWFKRGCQAIAAAATRFGCVARRPAEMPSWRTPSTKGKRAGDVW